jgi:hypothetical protein
LLVSYAGLIALEPGVAEWLRKQADDENITVSMLIDRLLEREMHAPDRYCARSKTGKSAIANLGVGIDAAKRFTRDDAHER